jgi:hypothetical protein
MEYSNSYSMASDIWGPGVPSYIPSQPTVHRNAAAHRHHEPNITYPPSKAKKRTNIVCLFHTIMVILITIFSLIGL